MSPAEIIAKIDALHESGKFFGLTIWPTRGGYQANVATTSRSNWRVRTAGTPSEALALVLGMDFMDNGVEPDREPEMIAPPAVDEPPIEELLGADEAGIFD